MIPTLLNEKIHFITVKNNGSYGGGTTETIVKTTYANVLNLNNSEFIQSYSTNASVIVSFRVVYTRFTKEIPFKTKDYKITWKGNCYNIITAVPSPDMDYMDIKCKVVL